MTREDLIDDFIRHCSDIFPYNDPDYEKKLLEAAESYADDILNPESELNKIIIENFGTIENYLGI